jgi:hypothetical protein
LHYPIVGTAPPCISLLFPPAKGSIARD